MNKRLAAILVVLVFAACGSTTASPPAATSAATSATTSATTTTSTTTNPATTNSATAGSTVKVSANNATNEQLIAAFTAAGIPNPSSWAREVQEYRPYAATDTNLTKLRQNLVKYNPAAGVVDKIVATLSLP